jgi:hypothetical protein
MADLGDRRRVAEQPEEVELALLGQGRGKPGSECRLPPRELRGGGIVGGRVGRLAHLPLDLSHELQDPGRRRVRLRALLADDRAVTPVGRKKLYRCATGVSGPDQ